jgi:protein-S-isoprenylcysteine O-methyltransferase Ste14
MSSAVAFGRFLFKIRSYSPVPVVAAILWLLARDRAVSVGGPEVEALLLVLGLLACALGQALRAWVLGLVQNGTSGQNDYLEAVALNTAGPYAHVRNPLYVGNFLIILGLSLIVGHPLAGALGLGFFIFEYAFIVPAEEDFLRSRFGTAFDAYCAEVPRWLWRPTAANDRQLGARFDWQRALKKEHNPLAAWLSGILVVLGLRAWFRSGEAATGTLVALAVAEAVLLVVYVAVKGWKRRWFASPDVGRASSKDATDVDPS